MGGVHTAVVTGPQGAETFVDSYGRIKVHFGFDRDGPVDANSSCWVRVAQVWAGKKEPKEALDAAVKRGNEQLERFQKANK